MKKGCFVKIIVVLTILTAVILYLVQNKFDELIFNPGKKFLAPLLMNQIEEEIGFVKDTPEKDSLKVLISTYIDKADKIEKISDEKIDDIINFIKNRTEDSLLTKTELQNIKELLNKNLKVNERPD